MFIHVHKWDALIVALTNQWLKLKCWKYCCGFHEDSVLLSLQPTQVVQFHFHRGIFPSSLPLGTSQEIPGATYSSLGKGQVSEKNKVVLVTGAAGFIGFHLSAALQKMADVEVVAVDGFMNNVEPQLHLDRAEELRKLNVRLFRGDVCDRVFFRFLFESFSITHVVHLAACAGIRRSMEEPAYYLRNNVDCFLALLHTVKEHKVSVFTQCKHSYLYVCIICVCTCVCACACVHVCVLVHVYMCVFVHVYICVSLCMCICVCACLFMCICVCLCMCVYVCVLVSYCDSVCHFVAERHHLFWMTFFQDQGMVSKGISGISNFSSFLSETGSISGLAV